MQAEQLPQNKHTPHKGWYDIVRRGNHLQFFTFSRDGFRLQLHLYHSPESKAPLLLLIPDIYQRDVDGMQEIIQGLQSRVHLLVVYPRGQHPRPMLYNGHRPEYKELTRTLKQSKLYWRDYTAALNRVKELQEPLRIKPVRTCILAGDFHSNLILQSRIAGVDCIVLLSPERRFFQKDSTELIDKDNKVPILILSNPYQASRIKHILSALPDARLMVGKRSGSGLELLYRNRDLLDALRRFVLGQFSNTSPVAPGNQY